MRWANKWAFFNWPSFFENALQFSGNRLLRQGWISLGLWIAFGVLIEGLIGFRIPALVDDPIRRELLRLAHAHGTLLNLVLLIVAVLSVSIWFA